MALPSERKMALVVFTSSMDFKKSNGQINSCIPGTKGVLIWSSNETMSGTTAAIGIITWLSLRQSTLILQHPSVFYTG